MYYIFSNLEEFDTWHNQVKEEIGLPFEDGITTNYTEPIILDDGQVVAFSEELYSEGLTSCDYVPKSLEYGEINE
jgi:hypothetical protein